MNHIYPPTPLRFHIFSQPRSGSNLFCKILSEHPIIKQHLYTITYAQSLGPEAQSQIKNPVMEELVKCYWEANKNRTYQNSLDNLEQIVAETEAEGKIPLLKDHPAYLTDATEAQKMLVRHRDIARKPIIVDHELDVPSEKRNSVAGKLPYDNRLEEPFNPTVLPSRFMKTLAPIFIIRHPIRQIESWYRTGSQLFGLTVEDPDFELCASYRFSRRVYDYYKALYGQQAVQSSKERALAWPVVIDGDDLVNDSEGVVNKFCDLTGLDPGGVIYKWEKKDWFDPGPVHELFFGTLSRSEGIRQDLYPKEANLKVSAEKWRKDWGDEVANALIQYVQDVMGDYQYLYQFRL